MDDDRIEVWLCKLCEIAGTREEAFRLGCWDQDAKSAGAVRLNCPIEQIVSAYPPCPERPLSGASARDEVRLTHQKDGCGR